ncbi:acetate--CoA ligase family protein [Candidatus Binatus sp.]|uniref:acetate--CoA ligase family protein n=1 Tax=Candidatus Binatus sp. TaxID=2811406 RepID=UPI002FD9430F
MNTKIVDETIARAAAERRSALSEIESKRILEAIGIATQMPEPARSADEAAAAAERRGFPVVLKVLSPDVTHKSDVGGVALGLASKVEVREAFARIRANLSQKAPDARFEGVAVQAMAAAGPELLAGIVRDPQFGPMVMVGLGGVFVEVLKDTAVRIAPIDKRETRAMLAELRGAALLDGVRGQAAVDRDAIAELLVRISEFAARRTEIREMDLNPIAAYASGLSVLDARILLEHEVKEAAHGDLPAAEAAALQARRQENLRRALKPRTAIVIGDRASRDFMWLRALDNFKGKRFSVQPDAKDGAAIEALGIKNFRTVSEIGEPIDYAIASVPRKIAPQTLAECAGAAVAGIGFFTAGFSETGDPIGVELEAELKKVASRSDIALVGPNCMGLCNPGLGLLNSGSLLAGEPGDVCFISQSGTHAISFCMQAPGRAIKVSMSASFGNALVLEAADYLDVMASDAATRAVGIYVEGVRDGRRFFESLKRATARVPVLVWKGGVTDSGARATFSHTGSLATPAAVWRAAMRQSGAVEVAGLEPMLDAMELLTRARPVRGRGMALVAMTGGQSVVISDTFASHGLEVPALSEASYAEFKSFFQVIGGSYRNPLDASWTLGPRTAGGQDNVDRVLDILDRDPVIDAIVMEVRPGLGFGGPRRPIDAKDTIPLLDRLARFAQRAHKPFAIAVESQHVVPDRRAAVAADAAALARERGLATFDTFERAAGAFRAAAEYFERAGASAKGPIAVG